MPNSIKAIADGKIRPDMERADVPDTREITVVTLRQTVEDVKIAAPAYVSEPTPPPSRIIPVTYIEIVPAKVVRLEDRAYRVIDALELLAELADPAIADKVIEILREDGERASRVLEGIHAVSQVEAALKSRLS